MGKTKNTKKMKDEGLAWSWADLANLVKFSKSPIQASAAVINTTWLTPFQTSLLRFEDDANGTINKTAQEWWDVRCHRSITDQRAASCTR